MLDVDHVATPSPLASAIFYALCECDCKCRVSVALVGQTFGMTCIYVASANFLRVIPFVLLNALRDKRESMWLRVSVSQSYDYMCTKTQSPVL